MARAASFSTIGGPEVIEWIDVDLPPPGRARCGSKRARWA